MFSRGNTESLLIVLMVGPPGIEPGASSLGKRCCVHFYYGPIGSGAGDPNRTGIRGLEGTHPILLNDACERWSSLRDFNPCLPTENRRSLSRLDEASTEVVPGTGLEPVT